MMALASWFAPGHRRSWLRLLKRDPLAIRFYGAWYDSLQPGRSPLSDRRPWITFAAHEWLSARINRSTQVFEWGSGGSTLFFAGRVDRLVSVEHDPEWYHTVRHALASSGLDNVTYRLIEPEAPATLPDPTYLSSDPHYLHMQFCAYASAIDSYPDESFDLVIVDGRARVGCIRHAIPKLRSGGLMVLDNAERPAYSAGHQMLHGWPRWEFAGPGPYGSTFWSTTLWRKPGERSRA